MVFLVVRLGKKKKRCTWILKVLEEISGGIICSKNAICSKSVPWLLWKWTFYPSLSSSSRASSAFFFLCNSAAMCLPAVLWFLSYVLLWVKQSPAEHTWLTVACPHTKSATSLSGHSGSLTGHLHSWSLSNLFTSSFPPDFSLWADMPPVK